MISVLGWFIWNWAELTIKQQSLVKDGDPNTNFRFIDHAREQWPMWIGSFVTIFVLLIFGSKQMDLHPLSMITTEKLGWNDLYYFLSGAAFEGIIFGFKWLKKYFKNKE